MSKGDYSGTNLELASVVIDIIILATLLIVMATMLIMYVRFGTPLSSA